MKVAYKIAGKEVSPEGFRAGNEDRLQAMLAAGVPPMSNTDREFLEGHCNGSQFEKDTANGDRLAREAKAAGVDPKGKVYLGGLAAFPGDPRAWVSDRHDVKKLCEERNFGCDGSVKHRPVSGMGEPTIVPDSVPGDT